MSFNLAVAQGSHRGDDMRSGMVGFEAMTFVPGFNSWQENRVPDELADDVGAPVHASLPKGGE